MKKKIMKKWNELTYGHKHKKIKKTIPEPGICPICKKKKKLSITNLNHEYNKNLEDWVWKCASCHKKYDFEKGLIDRKKWKLNYKTINNNINIEDFEDLIFKLVKKPTKKGNQYYFNIPIEFIRSKRIELNKEYELLCFRIEKK